LEQRRVVGSSIVNEDVAEAISFNSTFFFQDCLHKDAAGRICALFASPIKKIDMMVIPIITLVLNEISVSMMAQFVMKCTPRDRVILGTVLKRMPEDVLDRLCEECDYSNFIEENKGNVALVARQELLVRVSIEFDSPLKIKVIGCQPIGIIPRNTLFHVMEVIAIDSRFDPWVVQ
jgi:hypothetical protein